MRHNKLFNIPSFFLNLETPFYPPRQVYQHQLSIFSSPNTAYDIHSKSFKAIYHCLRITNNVCGAAGDNPFVCEPARIHLYKICIS